MNDGVPAGQAPGLPSSVPPEPGSSLLSDARLSTLGAVGATCMSGVASILIARSLGVSGRGRWAVISSLALLVATVAATGLPVAAAYGAARLRSTDRERLVQSALTGAAVFGLLAALVYLVVAAVVRPPASTASVIIGCGIPMATIWYAVSHQLTLTVSSMRWFAFAQLLNAAITLTGVIALDLAGDLTVTAVVVVSIGGSVIGAAVSVAGLRISRGVGAHLLTSPALAARVLRPYLAYAMITFATLSLTQIVQRLDVLLVNGFKGPRDAGLYAVSGQITDLMLVVPAALGLVMFRRSAQSAPTHYSDVVRVLRWTGLFGLVAALFALAIVQWIIPIVYGSAYRGSVEPLRLLLPGTVAFSLQSVLSQYLAGRGRPRVVLRAWLTGAVCGVGADLLIIPAYGITGAAIVSSTSYLLVTGLHFQALRGTRTESSGPI